MRKRIISLLLTLVMLLSLAPALDGTASAVSGEKEVNSYAELKAALEGNAYYIKLNRDIDTMYEFPHGLTPDDVISISSKAHTLDLNGKTLTLRTKSDINSGAMAYIDLVDSELIIKDSLGGGQIRLYQSSKWSIPMILVRSESALYMTGGKLTSIANGKNTPGQTLIHNAGDLEIQGGELYCTDRDDNVNITEKDGVLEFGDDTCYAIYSNPKAGKEVNIEGGKFTGVLRFEVNPDNKNVTTISGGTFKSHVGFFADRGILDGAFHISGGIFSTVGLYKKRNEYWNAGLHDARHTILAISGGTFDEFNVCLNDDYWVRANRTCPYPAFQITGGTFKGMEINILMNETTEELAQYYTAEAFRHILDGSCVKIKGKTYIADNIYEAMTYYYDTDTNLHVYEFPLYSATITPAGDQENVEIRLDGNSIKCSRDEPADMVYIDNSTAHTITFQWSPMSQALQDAGYSYVIDWSGTTPDRGKNTSGIGSKLTKHTVTIPAGAATGEYIFDLCLSKKKDGSIIQPSSSHYIVHIYVKEAPKPDPVLTGRIYHPSAIVYGNPISTVLTGLPEGLSEADLSFQWQRRYSLGYDWDDIKGATNKSYTPTAEDIGENTYLRVTVTAKGYTGQLAGSFLRVSKASNDKEPVWPQLQPQKDDSGQFTGFRILNWKDDQEYVYTTTQTEGWPQDAVPISSEAVTGLTPGSTCFIYTRCKGTDTIKEGVRTGSGTVLLADPENLHKLVLCRNGRPYADYGKGNTIFLKKGASVTLDVSINPTNANKWQKFTFKPENADAVPQYTVTTSTGSNVVNQNQAVTSITITGKETGSASLAAEYPGYPTPNYYGKWRVFVYEDPAEIGTNADIRVTPSSLPDVTLQPGETLDPPEYEVSVFPEGAMGNYRYEWRVLEENTGAAPGSNPYQHVTDNGYLSVDPKTGAVTALKPHPEDVSAYYKTVGLCVVSQAGNPLPGFLVSYQAAVTEAEIELTGLHISPEKLRMGVDATYQLTAVKDPVNAPGDITWTSSNSAVADVDKFGIVTAVAEGTAVIKATCGGKEATCTVTVELSAGHNPFTDVAEDAYYRDAVVWAVNQGVTSGTSATTFLPDGICTRAQAVTFLWRAAGAPASKSASMPFTDVPKGSWYYDAVLWAVEQDITKGTGPTTFSPDLNCSRGQIVTFLWRSAKSPAAGTANPFTDVNADAYYADAVLWAVKEGVTNGSSATTFSPDVDCSRAQIVTFIYRHMTK